MDNTEELPTTYVPYEKPMENRSITNSLQYYPSLLLINSPVPNILPEKTKRGGSQVECTTGEQNTTHN